MRSKECTHLYFVEFHLNVGVDECLSLHLCHAFNLLMVNVSCTSPRITQLEIMMLIIKCPYFSVFLFPCLLTVIGPADVHNLALSLL